MENKDQGVDFRKYITILKRTTIFVQFLPFVYSFFYIIALAIYPLIPESSVRAIDTIFYISPAFMTGILVLSKLLRLCKWHRMACIVPIISQIPVFIDNYIVSLSQIEAIVSNCAVLLMAFTLMISAYNVFFR